MGTQNKTYDRVRKGLRHEGRFARTVAGVSIVRGAGTTYIYSYVLLVHFYA